MAPWSFPWLHPWGRRDFDLLLPQFPAGKEESPPAAGKVGGEGCCSMSPLLIPLQCFSLCVHLPVVSREWSKGHRHGL